MAHRNYHTGGMRIHGHHKLPSKVDLRCMPAGDSEPLPTNEAAEKALARLPPRESVDIFGDTNSPLHRSEEVGTVQDLLADQLVAVERALAFNQVISQRLFGKRPSGKGFESTPSSWQDSKGNASNVSPLLSRMMNDNKGFSNDLSTPLLSGSNKKVRGLGEEFPSPRSSSVASWSSGEYHQCVREPDGSGKDSKSALGNLSSSDYQQYYQKVQERDANSNMTPGAASDPLNTVAYAQFHAVAEKDISASLDSSRPQRTAAEILGLPADPGSMTEEQVAIGRGKSERILRLFPSVEDIQKLVVNSLGDKHADNIPDRYNRTGFFPKLAASPAFHNFSLVVILLNTIWIAIDTDLNKADILCEAPLMFQVIENVFCTYFVFEMMVRIMAFKNKRDAFTDKALVFDCALVASMVWETWILVLWFKMFGAQSINNNRASMSVLRLFRLFRLTRVARTARLVSNVPELMILAKGMIVAVRAVAAVLCLLGIVIYVFSIIFTVLLRTSDELAVNFDSVPRSMNTLLLQVVCGFDLALANDLVKQSAMCYFIFLVYFLIASLTLMNMLIGILCDVVSNVATDEKEDSFVQEVEGLVGHLMEDLDTDGSHTLSKDEFDQIILNQDMTHVLIDFGVDVVGIVDFASFLFQECDELSFADFMQLVIQFRVSKQATIKDVMDLRKYLARELSCLEASLEGKMALLGRQRR